jgi:hypothetical protein
MDPRPIHKGFGLKWILFQMKNLSTRPMISVSYPKLGLAVGFFKSMLKLEIDTYSYSFDPSRTVLVRFSMVQI